MQERTGTYRFEPPSNIPGGTITVPNAVWLECENCGEQLLPAELDEKLQSLSIQRQGLLLPGQIKAVREKLGLTQTTMAERLGVGEKTYTRWESGRSIQNKSSDNLIRLMDRVPEQFAAIEAQRNPERSVRIADYFGQLGQQEGYSKLAMAAHDADLDVELAGRIKEALHKALEKTTTFETTGPNVWTRRQFTQTEPSRTGLVGSFGVGKTHFSAWASAFRPDFLALELSELAEFLLREAGQLGDRPTNPAALLDYLKLQFVMIDLAAFLSGAKKRPRGVLSYFDRIVGVDGELAHSANRARFTTLHEIAHFVLPNHQQSLYIDDEDDLSFEAKVEVEREANAFAAELLFKGDQFTREANDCDITAESIKTLALRYETSFEATGRRFVERSARACSLAVFGPAPGSGIIDTSRAGRWQHRYTVSSAEFRTRYFRQFLGEVPVEVIKKLVVPNRDFADSIDNEMTVTAATGEEHKLHVSFFTNHHCVFGLVQPATSG